MIISDGSLNVKERYKVLDQRQQDLVLNIEQGVLNHRMTVNKFSGGLDPSGKTAITGWDTKLDQTDPPRAPKGKFKINAPWSWSFAVMMDSTHRRKLTAYFGIRSDLVGIPLMISPSSNNNTSNLDPQEATNEFLLRFKASIPVMRERLNGLDYLMSHGDTWSALSDWCRMESRGERDEKFPWPRLQTVDQWLNDVCGRDAIRPIDLLCIGQHVVATMASIRQMDIMLKLVNILLKKSPV